MPNEYLETGIIRCAKLIPLGELMSDLGKLEAYKDKEIVVLCAFGGRSFMAAQLLVRAGFSDVRNLVGGIRAWLRLGYSTIDSAIDSAVKYLKT
jgi:hydroxyacylglutathione hydrolase